MFFAASFLWWVGLGVWVRVCPLKTWKQCVRVIYLKGVIYGMCFHKTHFVTVSLSCAHSGHLQCHTFFYPSITTFSHPTDLGLCSILAYGLNANSSEKVNNSNTEDTLPTNRAFYAVLGDLTMKWRHIDASL